jgi:hypothetical protein
MTQLLTDALAWHDAGYCVVPSHEDGSKRPFGPWKDYQTTRPTREQLIAWLSGGTYTGIGVICGAVSGGVEMVEIESRAILNGSIEFLTDIARRSNIDDIWGTVLGGCAEQSGGGGIHMLVRLEGEPVPGNAKLAANRDGEVLAETRGEGGFVIVAPSPGRAGHHSNYTLLPGSHPDRTPTLSVDERRELHNLLRTLDDAPARATPDPRTSEPRPATPHTGLTPGDDYNARTDWADILIPAGWTQLNTSTRLGHPITWWTRPGKGEGVSASTGGEGDWLYVFSSSTSLPAETPLQKFYVYAHYNHDGDMNAAAKVLARDGYGTPLTALADLAPWEYTVPGEQPGDEVDEARAGQWVEGNLQQLDWHALWADETEEEWIVEPLLPARRLVALYSAHKVGKSLLMLELAAAVATGREVLGVTPARRHVLYVDFENDPRGDIRERLQAMNYAPNDLDWLHYLSFPTLAALDTERGSKELLAAVEHYAADVVFIDTVSRSVQGEENENDTWLKFYRHTGLKLKQAGVALMRLDHSGKDVTKGQRGGSAKVGDVDAVWRMSAVTETKFRLECEAHRFPVGEPVLIIDRHLHPLRHTPDTGGQGSATEAKRAKIIATLDALEVPRDASRTVARKALEGSGLTMSHDAYKIIQEMRQTALQTWLATA